MIKKVYDYCRQFNMLEVCDNIIVGLSGGADSVCLLLVLSEIISRYRLPIKITAVHINHGIRGKEADSDEEFSRKLCETLGILFIAVRKNVPQIAKERGLSEEEAGRLVRYEAFEQHCEFMTNCRIAVAHHKDDQAETVLMNIIRGSSLKGASGISPVRGDIIRPLLCVTRCEIEQFLYERKQAFVTDSTNLSTDYTRNRLRNELVPYIKSNFNENFVSNITSEAEDFSLAYEYIRESADKIYDLCVVKNAHSIILKQNGYEEAHLIVKREVVMNILKTLSGEHKDIYRKHIEAVINLFDMQVGKSINLPYGIEASKSYGCIIFSKKKIHTDESDKISCAESVVLTLTKKELLEAEPDNGLSRQLGINILGEDGELVFARSISFKIIKFIEKMDDNGYTKYFDCDKIKGNLCVRLGRREDYLSISADGKRKLLSKDFVDKKILREYRDRALVVADDDEVLWAVGVRRSRVCYVDDKSCILEIRINVED